MDTQAVAEAVTRGALKTLDECGVEVPCDHPLIEEIRKITIEGLEKVEAEMGLARS